MDRSLYTLISMDGFRFTSRKLNLGVEVVDTTEDLKLFIFLLYSSSSIIFFVHQTGQMSEICISNTAYLRTINRWMYIYVVSGNLHALSSKYGFEGIQINFNYILSV